MLYNIKGGKNKEDGNLCYINMQFVKNPLKLNVSV